MSLVILLLVFTLTCLNNLLPLDGKRAKSRHGHRKKELVRATRGFANTKNTFAKFPQKQEHLCQMPQSGVGTAASDAQNRICFQQKPVCESFMVLYNFGKMPV